MTIEPLLHWIAERERVRLRREAGKPNPWSSDHIFQMARFCNVERERDRTTVWIAKNWREPRASDPDLFFGMVVARFVNEPDTLAEIGYPAPWTRAHFLDVMRSRGARGERQFGAAYVIHADNKRGAEGRSVADYLAYDVFDPLWRDRKAMRPRTGETLAACHRRLMAREGLGGFMAAQVIADVKYVSPLDAAADWADFAVSGPGSRRGLNLLLGRSPAAPWSEAEWRAAFDRLREALMPELAEIGLGDLHAQDLQNCCCEFSKYASIQRGGRPKRRFDGAGLGGLFG